MLDRILTETGYFLEFLVFASGLLVWVGVYLEKITFRKAIQDIGWAWLVRGLALETVFGALLFLDEGVVTRRAQTESASLRLEAATLEHLNLEMSAAIRPRMLGSIVDGKISFPLPAGLEKVLPGRTIRIISNANDPEGAIFATQIRDFLSQSSGFISGQGGDPVKIQDCMLTYFSVGSMAFGVHISGPDSALSDYFSSLFKMNSITYSKAEVPPSKFTEFQCGGSQPDFTIFVGSRLPEYFSQDKK